MLCRKRRVSTEVFLFRTAISSFFAISRADISLISNLINNNQKGNNCSIRAKSVTTRVQNPLLSFKRASNKKVVQMGFSIDRKKSCACPIKHMWCDCGATTSERATVQIKTRMYLFYRRREPSRTPALDDCDGAR